MSVDDAKTGDIYADANGKLWRILNVVHEPTVEAEEVEGVLRDPNNPAPLAGAQCGAAMVAGMQNFMGRAEIVKAVRRAPTGSSVWLGFDRVYRRRSGSGT